MLEKICSECNMRSICRPAVAQWKERLTRKGQTRVRNWKGANILLSQINQFNKTKNNLTKIYML